ncbi:MAG: alpha/beta fold hydrolase, partial [Actinobacteria bacterium]|nr:alpha/beta fold hydrolase [Actinomycetota bacterium]
MGAFVARRLTDPAVARRFDLVVRGIEADGQRSVIVLDRTAQTVASGVYLLLFEGGGWVQLGEEILDRGPDRIARRIVCTGAGFTPAVDERGSWSGIYFPTPTDAGLEASEIILDTPAGPAPAWMIPGVSDSSAWAIHIHGLGSTRVSTLRGVQVAREIGLTSLVPSFRNDGEGPRRARGRSELGYAEVDDIDVAIQYALRHGAQRIVLFGWSMGAIIALQLAERPQYRNIIAGLVLDSPVLDWNATIKANCVRAGLPAVVGDLAMPWLSATRLARLIGLSSRIPIRTSWGRRGRRAPLRILILHGARDDSAPISAAEAIRDRSPQLVELIVFDAAHTMPWNADRDRWRMVVTTWLMT